jgi:2-polyprenyl-3-methyl-5-hydroxy-6-metoxy-1,4-benzoquinol methylase
MRYTVAATELQESVEFLSTKLKSKGIDIKAWGINTEPPPFSSNTFDVIIAAEVLEHLQVSLYHYISKLYKVLKKDGFLIITTPNIYRLFNLFQILKNDNICEDFPDTPLIKNDLVIDSRWHPREPTMKELIKATSRVGLNVIKYEYFNSRTRNLFKKLLFAVFPKRTLDSLLVVCRAI